MIKIRVLRVVQTPSGSLSNDSYVSFVRGSLETAQGAIGQVKDFLVDGVPYVYRETPQGDELQALNYAVELVRPVDTTASDAKEKSRRKELADQLISEVIAELGVNNESSK